MANFFQYLSANSMRYVYFILFIFLVIYSFFLGEKLTAYLKKEYYDIWLEASKGGLYMTEKWFQILVSPPCQLKKDVKFNKSRKKLVVSMITIFIFFLFIIVNEFYCFYQ